MNEPSEPPELNAPHELLINSPLPDEHRKQNVYSSVKEFNMLVICFYAKTELKISRPQDLLAFADFDANKFH